MYKPKVILLYRCLNKHLMYGDNTYLGGQRENVLRAMDEYAKEYARIQVEKYREEVAKKLDSMPVVAQGIRNTPINLD